MIRLWPITLLNNQETIRNKMYHSLVNREEGDKLITIAVKDVDGKPVNMQYAKRPDGKYESVLEIKVVL